MHFRNLPFDLTVEEIRELCAPWGTVVAVKDKASGASVASGRAARGFTMHLPPAPAVVRDRSASCYSKAGPCTATSHRLGRTHKRPPTGPRSAVAPYLLQVGNMKNQAFVEFQAIEQAIAIVTHYAHSPEPAKFRGRPTWLSYRCRQGAGNWVSLPAAVGGTRQQASRWLSAGGRRN